jgi:alpha-galactosidase
VNLQTVIPLAASNLSYPGCRAYPDMLEVGVPPGLHPNEKALSLPEQRAHFGAWAIVSSPLVLGLDVRNATLLAEVR